MRQKLVTLVVGVLVASVLALPATAAPGKGPKHPVPAACKQAATDAVTTFRQQQRDAAKTFHLKQKAARDAFRGQVPAPTPDQIKTFREQMHAAVNDFVQQHRDAVKAFRKGQRASVRACATNA